MNSKVTVTSITKKKSENPKWEDIEIGYKAENMT